MIELYEYIILIICIIIVMLIYIFEPHFDRLENGDKILWYNKNNTRDFINIRILIDKIIKI